MKKQGLQVSMESDLLCVAENHGIDPKLILECASQICDGCGCDVYDGSYYMAKDHIWRKAGVGKYQLCLDCLEYNLGRELKVSDFKELDMNFGEEGNWRLLSLKDGDSISETKKWMDEHAI